MKEQSDGIVKSGAPELQKRLPPPDVQNKKHLYGSLFLSVWFFFVVVLLFPILPNILKGCLLKMYFSKLFSKLFWVVKSNIYVFDSWYIYYEILPDDS